MLNPIRTYEVSVQGFPGVKYSARSPGKARARCYRDYQAYDDRDRVVKMWRNRGIPCAQVAAGNF